MAHNDIKDAQSTYAGFISGAKIGAVLVALVTIFVVIIIQ